jgi:hypothetical protein
MFLGLLGSHPDPLFIFRDPEPSINKKKNVEKNFDIHCLTTSLKNDVNVPSKRK